MPAMMQMMAEYNRWANRRLYAAARGLSDADYRRDLKAFFASVHGTLNHVLVADRIWMHRFTGNGPQHHRLDEIVCDDLDSLEAAREAEDRRIIDYVASLDEAALRSVICYRTLTAPREIEQPLLPALTHFFNHQTHHRGQVHCLLTQLDRAAPSLDLIMFQRESGLGLAARG